MNHIKPYKIFESKDKAKKDIEYIKDILLELGDDNFDANPSMTAEGLIFVPVEIYERYLDGYTRLRFSYDLIRDTFNRIINYMEDEGYDHTLEYLKEKLGGNQWVKFSGKNTDKKLSFRLLFKPKRQIIDWDKVNWNEFRARN